MVSNTRRFWITRGPGAGASWMLPGHAGAQGHHSLDFWQQSTYFTFVLFLVWAAKSEACVSHSGAYAAAPHYFHSKNMTE